MLTTPNNYDTLLDSNRETDFLLSNNRHRVGLRNFRFSIANRNVPFYLEDKMPSGYPNNGKSNKGWFKKGHINFNPTNIGGFKKGRIGKEAGRWKNGKTIHMRGYILIYQPNHPFKEKNNYVFRSRFIMEQMLGRYLKPKEVVHHKGIRYPLGSIENRQDDRPENLRLFSNDSKHKKNHYKYRKINKLGQFLPERKGINEMANK